MKWYDFAFLLASFSGLYAIGLTKYGLECLISGLTIGAYFMWRYKSRND